MRKPKYGYGDIIVIKKEKRVGIIKDVTYYAERDDYTYSVAWLGEFLDFHPYREDELKKY